MKDKGHKIQMIIMRILLVISGVFMTYISIEGLLGLYQTFTSEGFFPFKLRPFLIPYYMNALAMLIMLYSGIVSILSVIIKDNACRLIISGIMGIIAGLIPRIMVYLMFGHFSLHYMLVAPLCSLLVGVWMRTLERFRV